MKNSNFNDNKQGSGHDDMKTGKHNTIKKHNTMKKDGKNSKNKLSDLLPLIIAFLIVIGTTALFSISSKNYSVEYVMRLYMSNFFIVFSLAKFTDLKGFIDAFRQYDSIAIKYPNYAIFYPLLELFLGVFYARGNLPLFTNLVTLVIMSATATGIFKALKEKGKVQCACLGTLFNIPLTSITLFENISMAVMAAYSLYLIFV